ncbi:MAG: hypothetical protein L3J57_00530 [Desulfuromusa sp.]|nr:hypothetical protein [Desulfuromusa sp.]
MDARKIRIDAEQAWVLLQNSGSITVAKGKKIHRFKAITAEKDAILKQVMGSSGNLRAPTYRVQDRFVVGFNTELYTDWVSFS